MRLRAGLAVLPLLLVPVACAPEEDDNTVEDPVSSPTTSDSAETASSEPVDTCAVDQLPVLTPGTLTVGTDSPAYEPWFVDNDPTNGEGYESAVAYAVAEQLGFSKDQVKWIKVPFNSSYAPGPKKFDFDINQISISPERAEVVDFSDGYYRPPRP